MDSGKTKPEQAQAIAAEIVALAHNLAHEEENEQPTSDSEAWFQGRFADATADPAVALEVVRAVFQMIDKNSDGELTRIEVIKALRESVVVRLLLQLPQHIRQEDGSRELFETVFQMIDSDGSSEISLSEFERYFSPHTSCQDRNTNQQSGKPDGRSAAAGNRTDGTGRSAAAGNRTDGTGGSAAGSHTAGCGSFEEFKAAILARHNKLRAVHGASALKWSDSCAGDAQLQADACAVKQSLFHGNKAGQGQNVVSTHSLCWYQGLRSTDTYSVMHLFHCVSLFLHTADCVCVPVQ